ncbi:hypothetical protein BDQ17DRAFT_1340196 [Cyathus striatus]|nr:hypothetical protein BDQ17DRAFT_1340196 [Cyathus striatus]
MFKFRRKEVAWEVVDNRSVDPFPYLDIMTVNEVDTRGTYVFEAKHPRQYSDLSNAVVFARQQLMKEVIKKGFNILMIESWSVTVYRREKVHRIEVQYSGRAARALGKIPVQRPPPFIGVLRSGL